MDLWIFWTEQRTLLGYFQKNCNFHIIRNEEHNASLPICLLTFHGAACISLSHKSKISEYFGQNTTLVFTKIVPFIQLEIRRSMQVFPYFCLNFTLTHVKNFVELHLVMSFELTLIATRLEGKMLLNAMSFRSVWRNLNLIKFDFWC